MTQTQYKELKKEVNQLKVKVEVLNAMRSFEFIQPTAAEKRAITRGQREYAQGNYVTLKQLKHELGLSRRRKRS